MTTSLGNSDQDIRACKDGPPFWSHFHQPWNPFKPKTLLLDLREQNGSARGPQAGGKFGCLGSQGVTPETNRGMPGIPHLCVDPSRLPPIQATDYRSGLIASLGASQASVLVQGAYTLAPTSVFCSVPHKVTGSLFNLVPRYCQPPWRGKAQFGAGWGEYRQAAVFWTKNFWFPGSLGTSGSLVPGCLRVWVWVWTVHVAMSMILWACVL